MRLAPRGGGGSTAGANGERITAALDPRHERLHRACAASLAKRAARRSLGARTPGAVAGRRRRERPRRRRRRHGRSCLRAGGPSRRRSRRAGRAGRPSGRPARSPGTRTAGRAAPGSTRRAGRAARARPRRRPRARRRGRRSRGCGSTARRRASTAGGAGRGKPPRQLRPAARVRGREGQTHPALPVRCCSSPAGARAASDAQRPGSPTGAAAAAAARSVVAGQPRTCFAGRSTGSE